ncbi:MAG: hypothetical protein ACXVC6_08845 [Bacteroidia bacterium]
MATCSKRPFAHVEIHGRVVNSKTNQPLQAEIQLWVGAGLPGNKGTSQYGSVHTGGDGAFDIKSKAQWSGNEYRLQIIPDSISTHASTSLPCEISRNQTLDVGTIKL